MCLIVFGCQYQCNWLPGKTRLRNDLLCVEWDVKPYTLTHSLTKMARLVTSDSLLQAFQVFIVGICLVYGFHFLFGIWSLEKSSCYNCQDVRLSVFLGRACIVTVWCTVARIEVSPVFWAPWHQSMSTYSQPYVSSTTWKRSGVWMLCSVTPCRDGWWNVYSCMSCTTPSLQH